MKKPCPKLSEKSVTFTLPATELNALNAYCAKQRRKTGDKVARAGVIRLAVQKLIEGGSVP